MKRIYCNGTILTMAREGECVEALLTEGGLIRKTGELRKLLGENTDVEIIDLQGRTLMPGFVDGHSHFLMGMKMAGMADLSGCSDYDDIIEAMKTFIEENKINESGVAVGWGYDHNFFPEERHPDKKVLDKISEKIPVCVVHSSGHMCCVNSILLKQAEINEKTPDPAGGKIGRMKGSEEPDGYLEESAVFQSLETVEKRMRNMTPPSIAKAEQMYLENGVTTVQEGGASRQSLETLLELDGEGKLHLDVVAYPLAEEGAGNIARDFPECKMKYHNHVKIGGCKLILDGSPQGKSAWLTKPYEHSGNYCGYPRYSDDQVIDFIKGALADGLQVIAHCNGDGAGDQFLRCYEKACRMNGISDFRKLRPVMIHCQTVRKDQLQKMAKIHMIASVFVGHVYYWGDIHMKNLGRERGRNISPCRWALDAEVPVNLHQDMPVTRPDMLHSIWCAVNRTSRSGQIIGIDQRISIYEAFRAASYGGAYSYYEEKQKGTLEPGKRADMIILDQNPFQIKPEEIKDIRVLQTIKDGSVVYRYERKVGCKKEMKKRKKSIDISGMV